MELLQNCGYNPEKPHDYHFLEIKIQAESIIELCQEGEISIYEAYSIFCDEYILAMQNRDALLDKLESLEGDIIGADEKERYLRNSKRARYRDALNDMSDYYEFLHEALSVLLDIPESKDYQQKRKFKLKSQIIHNGVALSLVKMIKVQLPREDHTTLCKDYLINNLTTYLFNIFPAFKDDYPLLSKNEYLEEKQDSLHWKKSKQSLAEYFHSIKPPEMEKMQWKQIESVFKEEDLKNSSSTNGNPFKGKSQDFLKWEKIKSTPLVN